MLAFLPAMCLAAFWIGGERLLVFSALCIPLIYAATGGFGRLSQVDRPDTPPGPTLQEVARDFLEMARLNGQTTACFQLGLCGLDEIDRSFGRESVTEVRALIQDRIASVLRKDDHVFHLGEARFAVLIAPGFRLKLDTLLDLATRLRKVVEEPISLAGTAREVTVSIGIASSLNFGRNVTEDSWLSSAAQALSEAVLTGPSTTRVWSDKLSRKQGARKALVGDVPKAFETGQFQAFFQPQIHLQTGQVVGMETLARWEHATLGLLNPAQFLRAVDDVGQLPRLGHVMLAQSMAALGHWDRTGLDVPAVSVNLSAAELRDPDLVRAVSAALDQTGIGAPRLTFDLPEALLTEGLDDMQHRTLSRLAEIGCHFDLDDFGTGSVALACLQSVPLNRVKIDRSLIKGIDTTPHSRRVLSAVLAMVHDLGLEAMAEGVETHEEHGALRDLGCTMAQGFLYAEPMPMSQLEPWLRTRAGQTEINTAPQIRRVK